MSLFRLRRAIARAWPAALVLLALAWYAKGRLPGREEIHPALLAAPEQGDTAREPFDFRYRGQTCRVRPVARYELHGLVVSHNDIESVADIYHDASSVDTKDLCVVWGANLERGDYRRVSYRSGSFTCYYRYPPGVRFWGSALGNNHLITDDPAIRDAIAGVRVGDQVRLSGLLVDYQLDDWRDFWRRTSTVRDDTGCEVVFVEELDVLRRATPGWYLAHRLAWWAVLGLPVAWLLVLWLEVGLEGTGNVGRLT